MMKFIKKFRKDEDGAVTVDWVVLTAAVVGLAVAAYSSIEGGAQNLTDRTTDFLDEQTPGAFGVGGEAPAPADPTADPG
jgi:Flp pilus assembly pilin Flp